MTTPRYTAALCHILCRADLLAQARKHPIEKIELKHISPKALSFEAIEKAELIVVKFAHNESKILKDKYAESHSAEQSEVQSA